MSDSSFSSSSSTIILDEVPCKRLRIENARDAVSAKQVCNKAQISCLFCFLILTLFHSSLEKFNTACFYILCMFVCLFFSFCYQLVEAVLRSKSGGEEVLQEYQATETLTDATRRQMVNILVAHMIDSHGYVCFVSLIFVPHDCMAIA